MAGAPREGVGLMDSTPKSGAGGESESRVAVAQYLWEEYRYRHDLIWRLLFRVTAVATTLSIAPFGIEDLVREKVGLWVAFLPVLAVLLVVGSAPLFSTELHRFHKVKDFYREVQSEVVGQQAHDSRPELFNWLIPLYRRIYRKAQNDVVGGQVHASRPDLFDWLIPLYLSILLILSLIVTLLVWFKWYSFP
jgi:hypothetical protein